MEKIFQHFVSQEEGSVTVDWIVLSAGLVGLTVALLAAAGGGTSDLANDTSEPEQVIVSQA